MTLCISAKIVYYDALIIIFDGICYIVVCTSYAKCLHKSIKNVTNTGDNAVGNDCVDNRDKTNKYPRIDRYIQFYK